MWIVRFRFLLVKPPDQVSEMKKLNEIVSLVLILISPSVFAGMSLSLSEGETKCKMHMGGSKHFVAQASGGSCNGNYLYSISKMPMHGKIVKDMDFATHGGFTYENTTTEKDGMGGMGGMGDSSTTSEIPDAIQVQADCGSESVTLDLEIGVNDPSVTLCSSDHSGVVILDSTATPNIKSISSNLVFMPGCNRDETTLDDGVGGNAISISDFQVLTRDISTEPHKLMLQIGDQTSTVDDELFYKSNKLEYFKEGKQLFELNRLRWTADWLSANASPDAEVPAGTYGTISAKQLLQNIANGNTMYGIVRVKLALVKGACGATCSKNALGQTVAASEIYGFCDAAGVTSGACTCAPGTSDGINSFKNIVGGASSLCGVSLPADAKIKVKGSLFWDFVDHATGNPIPLGNLPFAPRSLYFKVDVPVGVNAAHDLDDDGAMDNMDIIKAVSADKAEGELQPVIPYSSIPLESKQLYEYQTGKTLDENRFSQLNKPSQYHLLMPSGYANGWVAAFDKLNITAQTWSGLPSSGCFNDDGSPCRTFSIPAGVTGIMGAQDIRSDKFEDIPAYVYSGGLLDMHNHVNISGLVYIPQALEMEAKHNSDPTKQYIMGALLVRDGFYIEANPDTITVISADPSSYASAGTSLQSQTSTFVFDIGGFGSVDKGVDETQSLTDSSHGDTLCLGCSGEAVNTSGNKPAGKPGKRRWVVITPR